MIKYTGKKVVKNKKELIVLFTKLKTDGYFWGNGEDLLNDFETENVIEILPILLAFDAKNKKVYYSSYIDYEVEIDPSYR